MAADANADTVPDQYLRATTYAAYDPMVHVPALHGIGLRQRVVKTNIGGGKAYPNYYQVVTCVGRRRLDRLRLVPERREDQQRRRTCGRCSSSSATTRAP